MSINVTEAHDIEEFGFIARDGDGTVLYYITSGDGSPVGQVAPQNTLYFDYTNQDRWFLCGTDYDNDWILIHRLVRNKIDQRYTIKQIEEYRVRRLRLDGSGNMRIEGTLRIG